MHALRKYLQDGLDARAWQQADLVHASGLTRQRVSQMLSDDRTVLPSAPRRETLQALARAFRVSESTVTAVAFEAMGYDLEVVRSETDLSTATDEQLVLALADRLGVDLGHKERDDGLVMAGVGGAWWLGRGHVQEFQRKRAERAGRPVQ